MQRLSKATSYVTTKAHVFSRMLSGAKQTKSSFAVAAAKSTSYEHLLRQRQRNRCRCRRSVNGPLAMIFKRKTRCKFEVDCNYHVGNAVSYHNTKYLGVKNFTLVVC